LTLLLPTPLEQGTGPQPGTRERRRGLRIRQQRPVKVFDGHSARYMGGQTRDVSTTGMRLELPLSAPVVPGKVVSVHVGMSEQGSTLASRKRMMPVRVVWIDRTPDAESGRLLAGVEFLSSIAAHVDAA
jgi:hypothetical protein